MHGLRAQHHVRFSERVEHAPGSDNWAITFYVSAAIYFIYWRTRRVLPCILLHTANDLYAFLVVPLLMPEFS